MPRRERDRELARRRKRREKRRKLRAKGLLRPPAENVKDVKEGGKKKPEKVVAKEAPSETVKEVTEPLPTEG
jgi:hypothetical protein